MLPARVTHVAKTEDDALIHLPNLLADLAEWRSRAQLYYGVHAFAGFNTHAQRCGFDWVRMDGFEPRADRLAGWLVGWWSD